MNFQPPLIKYSVLHKLKYFTTFISHTLLGICFPNALILIYTLWRQSSFFFKLWKINIFKQTLFCDIWRAYCNQQYGWFLIALAPRLNKEQMHFSIANIWQYFRHVLCSVWLKSQSIEINVKNYSNHLRVYFCYSDRDVLYQQFSFWNDSESPYSAQQLPVLPCALINIHVICFVGSAILYVSCL